MQVKCLAQSSTEHVPAIGIKSRRGGAWVAQSIKHLTLNLSSGLYLSSGLDLWVVSPTWQGAYFKKCRGRGGRQEGWMKERREGRKEEEGRRRGGRNAGKEGRKEERKREGGSRTRNVLLPFPDRSHPASSDMPTALHLPRGAGASGPVATEEDS